jgi:hypothetical protein
MIIAGLPHSLHCQRGGILTNFASTIAAQPRHHAKLCVDIWAHLHNSGVVYGSFSDSVSLQDCMVFSANFFNAIRMLFGGKAHRAHDALVGFLSKLRLLLANFVAARVEHFIVNMHEPTAAANESTPGLRSAQGKNTLS